MKKNIKDYRKECSACLKWRETRQLNLKWQDFSRRYRKTFNETGFRERGWMWHTENYSLCSPCQKKWVKQLRTLI